MRVDVTTPAAEDRSRQAGHTYDAFLSYDHDDRPVAYGIQRGLHQIGRRVGQLRALRVFRDSTDLTASPDLWGKVTEAMDTSRYLIAVLSPQAAKSRWVDREISYWLECRGPDAILFVVADGQVVWDESKACFDPSRSSAAPPILAVPGSLPTEPLYVDVSGDAPWDAHSPMFREKVTDLAAPIHGKPKYELAGEDIREQRRFRRLRRAAVVTLALLTVLALVAAGYAFLQRQQAIHQRNEAVARQLVAEAQSMLAGVRDGTEIRAISQILAAQQIADNPDEGALLSALNAIPDQSKIIDNEDGVYNVRMSLNGKLIMAKVGDKIVLRDIASGRLLASMPGIAVSPNGTRVVSRVDSSSLGVRAVPTGLSVGPDLESLPSDEEVSQLTFTPDSEGLLFVREPIGLQRWDIATGVVKPLTGPIGVVSAMAISSDGRRVVTVDDAGTIHAFDLETGVPAAPAFSIGDSKGSNIALSPNGSQVITEGNLSNGICVWDLATGSQVACGQTHEPEFGNYIHSMSVSPDGQRVVTGSSDHTIQLWDAVTAVPIGDPMRGHRDWVTGVAFGPGGDTVISGSPDKTIRYWDIGTVGSMAEPLPSVVTSSVALSPDGRRLYWYGEGEINIWDTSSSEPVLPPLRGEAYDFTLSRDGSSLATVNDTSVTLWDTETGKRLRQWSTGQPLQYLTAHIVFSPDGSRIATYGGTVFDIGLDQTYDMSVAVWDPKTGEPVGTPTRQDTYLSTVAFSQDSQQLAYSMGNTVKIFEVATNRTVKEFPDFGPVFFVDWRPGAREILAANDRVIRLLDADSGNLIAEMADPSGIDLPMFSADGQYIISGHEWDIRIWDAEAHIAIGDLTGDAAITDAFVKSSDITMSDDNSLIAASFSAVTLSDDTWNVPTLWPGPAAWPEVLCSKIIENPSDTQWRDWIGSEIPYEPPCPGLPKSPS